MFINSLYIFAHTTESDKAQELPKVREMPSDLFNIGLLQVSGVVVDVFGKPTDLKGKAGKIILIGASCSIQYIIWPVNMIRPSHSSDCPSESSPLL